MPQNIYRNMEKSILDHQTALRYLGVILQEKIVKCFWLQGNVRNIELRLYL